MNLRISSAVLMFLAMMIFSSCSIFRGSKFDIEKIDVNDAFKKVYEATQQVLAETNPQSIVLEDINLSFATSTTNTLEGEVKLWVISGGYSRSSSSERTASFTFAKSDTVKKALTTDKNVEAFKNHLLAVITEAEKVQSINEFGLSELEVGMEFVLTKSGNAGAEIAIVPVTVSLSGKREKSYTHSITLNFKRKKSD